MENSKGLFILVHFSFPIVTLNMKQLIHTSSDFAVHKDKLFTKHMKHNLFSVRFYITLRIPTYDPTLTINL